MPAVCSECGQRYPRAGYCAADGTPLSETDDALLGSEVGRYRLARLIGEGGMGRVYLGVQPEIGSRVAIKVLSLHSAHKPDLLARFFAEARAVNLIRHESIANVLDLAMLPDGRPYIVMEYIAGDTLSRLVASGQAPLGGVVQVIGEVLSALAGAHALGIVHRDLKPDNVLVTSEGHAKVLDFGIAKLAPVHAPDAPRTRTGALLGTPLYMAPEQITGRGAVDARSDLYAVGVVLFEAITGVVPFRGETLYDLMKLHLEAPPPAIAALRTGVPASLVAVVSRALAKDPAQRFASAAEMQAALDAAAVDLPPGAWRSLSARGGWIARPAVRGSVSDPRTVMRILAGGAALLAVGVGIGAALELRKPAASDATVSAPVAPIAALPDAAPVVVVAAVVDAAPPAPASPPPPATTGRSPPLVTRHRVAPPPGVTVEGSVQFIETRSTVYGEPADYDPRAFDPVGYLARAQRLARRAAPDAALTSFEAWPVDARGRVDLTAADARVHYEWRSPARSTGPADEDGDRPCRVQVQVAARQASARVLLSSACADPVVRAPRCLLGTVVALAHPRGLRPPLRMSWLRDEQWFADSAPPEETSGRHATLPDACR